jgi:hypothetical protein
LANDDGAACGHTHFHNPILGGVHGDGGSVGTESLSRHRPPRCLGSQNSVVLRTFPISDLRLCYGRFAAGVSSALGKWLRILSRLGYGLTFSTIQKWELRTRLITSIFRPPKHPGDRRAIALR